MNPLEMKFCNLLDGYFNALVRGGTQTQIDEARLAIIAEYNRVLRGLGEVSAEYVLQRLRLADQSTAEQP